MEVKFYKAEDGDYDFTEDGARRMGVCASGLRKYTRMNTTRKTLYAKFHRKEPAHGHGFRIVCSNAVGLAGNEGEVDIIDLFSDFRNKVKEAYNKGYRWVEFQTEE